jgi:protein SCO1
MRKIRKGMPGPRSVHVSLAVLLVLVIAFSMVQPVSAHDGGGGSTIDPATISFDQNVNAQLPLKVSLVDETGQPVLLSQYFGAKPVILIFAYYNCTMLCNLALSDLAQNLKNLKSSAGTDFEVLTISFSTQDTPEMASAKKAAYMQIYDRPQAAKGWHFLTGKQNAIDQLTGTAGFHYQYDPANNDYAHPTGVILLSPSGKIMRYIFGIDYSATDLRLALLDANTKKIASPIDQIFLLCYHYDPVTGKYTVAINNILRMAGTLTVLGLAGLILGLSKRPDQNGFWRRLKTMLSFPHAHGH